MWVLLSEAIDDNIKVNDSNLKLIKIEKTTFLVGKNNSGKSYLLRNILKKAIKMYKNREEVITDLKESLKSYHNKKYEDFNEISDKTISDYLSKYTEMNKLITELDLTKKNTGRIFIDDGLSVYSFDNSLIEKCSVNVLPELGIRSDSHELCKKVANKAPELTLKLFNNFLDLVVENIDNINDENLTKMGKFLVDVKVQYQLEKYYFPVNRMIRHPLKNPNEKYQDGQNDDIFSKRFIKEYGFNDTIHVVTGLKFYNDYKSHLLGNKESREKIGKFETFVSEYFFDKQPIAIIPDEEHEEIKININNGEDRYIYEVGDGITSLLILMYTVFMEYDENKFKLFFIEEPENNFHPGYQKLFINMITSYKDFKNCYFIITTHSNHLIDTEKMSDSTLIYLCKNNDGNISVESKDKDYYDVLNELGVDLTSVLIANKVIWVEGKYDAFYIRKLLNLKNIKDNVEQKKYIEDYDYCFLPYGGSNMSLIDFETENDKEQKIKAQEFITKARKINPNFMVVLDNDGMEEENKEAKRKRFEQLVKKLGTAKVLRHDVREIENYFGEEIVKEFVKQNVVKNNQTDKFVDSLNISYNEYKMKPLGKYINEKINAIKKKKTYKTITGREYGFTEKNSNALFSKQKFYDVVCSFMDEENFSYSENITDEAKKMIDKIEKFIEE